MQANLENLGTLERRLSVAVPMAEIDQEVDDRLKRLTRTVKMHGFRPGKVPLKVVAQQYGPQVRQEVLGDALQKSFGEAVRQQNLKVAGYPRFDAEAARRRARSDFEYSATFEVYPEVAARRHLRHDDHAPAARGRRSAKSTARSRSCASSA